MYWRRLWNTIRTGRLHREIDREVAFHVDERADDLMAQGLSEHEARREARAQFGNSLVFAELVRDADVWMWLDARLRDLRHAARSLARAPGFTATVVATLGIGIGANLAVFSALDAVLLRPLAFPDADRLVQIRQIQERTAESNIAPIRLEDWQRMNSTFEAITGYYTENVSDTSGSMPERVRRAFVAPRFFQVWGVPLAFGRTFTESDEHGGMSVIVSHRYWHARLNADPNVLGRTLRLGSTTYPVIGVLPASFLFPDRDVDLWFPVSLDAGYSRSRQATWYVGIGRLRPGTSAADARANLALVQSQLGKQYPDSDAKIGVDVVPLKEVAVGGVRRSLWIVFGAVSMLLLITCTNTAAILLSRAVQRQHEISVRVSLGASRGAVAAQVLAETMLLSIVGGALGLLLAVGLIHVFRTTAPDLPRLDEVAIDGRILVYTLATILGVTVVCGGLPALRAGRGRRPASLVASRRTLVSSRIPAHSVLVVAQVAMSVVLLAGAGLLVRSFQQLARVDRGFEADRVLTFRVSGSYAETMDHARLRARIDDALERIRAVPGVLAAATTLFAPGVPVDFENTFTLVESEADRTQRLVADLRVVSPEYFDTMSIAVVEGETCRRQPVELPPELMVNRTFATRYLANRSSAVGLHLRGDASRSLPGRIVGVVADSRERGLDRTPGPAVYPCNSAPNPTPLFLVRAQGSIAELTSSLRLAMRDQDPLRSLYDAAPLEERIGRAFAANRVRTRLLVAFAGMALALACVGLYGTLSYSISLRRREVGLRLALGAARGGIVGHFLFEALRGVVVAIVLGLCLALGLTRLLSGMLFGVSPTDPIVLTSVAAIVIAVAALAAILPAMKAARVPPIVALQEN